MNNLLHKLKPWAAGLASLPLLASAAPAYQNPLPMRLASGALTENCADPALLRDQQAATPTWYLFCTTDPVSRAERDAQGWKFRMLPVFRSHDLVQWDEVGDAFDSLPAMAAPKAGLWAPEPVWFNGRYHLYFTITDVTDAHSAEPGCDKDSAIAVATAGTPTGPWQVHPTLVVPPRRAGAGCNFHWTFDPEIAIDADGSAYLYYGSYGGGMFVQALNQDGMRVTGKPTQIGAAGRYEGAEVVRRANLWYLFASATDCCNGPLTGYAVFVGRAVHPQGPFLDRQGNDMAAPRAGGTPFLMQNGNRWVGMGHNTVFADPAGQWWTIYHAIDRHTPYFSASDRLTRRLALLDRIDWIDGWPVASATEHIQAAPQLAPGTPPIPAMLPAGAAGKVLWREQFQQAGLAARWRWIRRQTHWSTGHAGLQLATQQADLHQATNNAAILSAPLPRHGNYRVELRMRLDAPDACCTEPVQAGLVVFGDDDNYLKLVELAHRGLRQVEFAKEMSPSQPDYPRYGNTVLGPPGKWTWLRMDVTRSASGQWYTAYSSQDGQAWTGGATWTHQLAAKTRLGLVAMGGAGHNATFSHVTVSSLPGKGSGPGLKPINKE